MEKVIQSKPASIGTPATVPIRGKMVLKTVSLKRSGKKSSTSRAPIEPTKSSLRHGEIRRSDINPLMSLNVLPACVKIFQRLGCFCLVVYVCDCIIAAFLLCYTWVIRIRRHAGCRICIDGGTRGGGWS